MTTLLSDHANRRCKQRGITQIDLDAILSHFDIDHSVGGGCRVLRISRKSALVAARSCGSYDMAARLPRIALVEHEDTGLIVTALRDGGEARGRRYRRAH
jgi:hypothetical protein